MKLVLVHKKEDGTLAENHRPISLLPIFRKMLKLLVYCMLLSCHVRVSE